MALLTRDQILTAQDLPRQTVHVPIWGGDVLVQALTAAQRDAYEASSYRDGRVSHVNLRARLVALAVIDADGRPLFTEADVEALGAKSAAALDQLFEVARDLSGFSRRDVEELEKNLQAPRDA